MSGAARDVARPGNLALGLLGAAAFGLAASPR